MAIVEPTRIVVNMTSLIRSRIVRLIYRVRVLLLQSHIILLAWQPFGIRILAVWAHVLIVLSCLVRVVRLLL